MLGCRRLPGPCLEPLTAFAVEIEALYALSLPAHGVTASRPDELCRVGEVVHLGPISTQRQQCPDLALEGQNDPWQRCRVRHHQTRERPPSDETRIADRERGRGRSRSGSPGWGGGNRLVRDCPRSRPLRAQRCRPGAATGGLT